MTPQEMNVKIAEILELDYAISPDNKLLVFNVDIGGFEAKDYTTDWNLCGPLMEKLLQAGWELGFSKSRNKYFCRKEGEWIILNESLLLATCGAFIEEFGK